VDVLTATQDRLARGALRPGPDGRSPVTRPVSGLLALLALSVTGCAAAGAALDPAQAAKPAAVALGYGRALFAGQFVAASRYVAPASRNGFLVLTDGLRPSGIGARDLAVGSTVINGPAAITVLTGTVCSGVAAVAPTSAGGAGAHDCVTNTDPHSTSPVFSVNLARAPDGQWLVVFPAPPGAPATGGAGAPVSSSTPAP
jgi:hypothetical protein